MLKSCRVTAYRRTTNLFDADVNIRNSEAEDGSDHQVSAVLQNEQYVEGFELTLVPEGGGQEAKRFLSDDDIRSLIWGDANDKRNSLTTDDLGRFCHLLTQRTTPITIAIFDSNVNLDEVERMPGITGDSLIGDEPGFSSLPKEGRQ